MVVDVVEVVVDVVVVVEVVVEEGVGVVDVVVVGALAGEPGATLNSHAPGAQSAGGVAVAA